MAKGSTSSRRRRWIVLLILVGAAVWYVRSKRSAAEPAGAQVWPVEPERAVPAPVAAVGPEAPTPSPTPKPRPRPAPAPEPEPPLPAVSQPAVSQPAQQQPDGSAPGPEYTIKGNADSMLFHTPSSPYYARTKAEVWFRTAEEASAAGFTEWTPKRRATN